MQITQDLAENFARAMLLMPYLERSLRVAVILLGAWAFSWLARRFLRRLRAFALHAMNKRGDVPSMEQEKRATTIVSALGKVLSVVIWISALVMSLNEMTFNIQPLLAGLGVVGLAVGLGTQQLIKDWMGGLLILVEDQLRIGDSVSINGIGGAVEELNLRTTVLRSESGAVHIISNGSIATISNMTRGYSYYLFETTLAHGTDIDRALQLLEETGAELAADAKFAAVILAPMEVMGVERLAERGIVIRARIQTVPAQQALVGRELNRRVSERWDAQGIKFPATPGV